MWFVVRDYVVYFAGNEDAAVLNHVSEIVAAVKRRHAKKDTPASDDVGAVLLPPPPPVPPEGSSEMVRENARERRDLYEESRSVRHLMTHSPPNPYCRACTLGKGVRHQHMMGALKRAGNKPTKEGELLTMDWIILKNDVSKGEVDIMYS